MTRYVKSKTFNHSQIKQSRGRAILNIIIILAIIIFVFIYILETNNLVKGSYEIRKYQKELELLAKENQNLQIKIAVNQSLNHLEEAIMSLGMVEGGEVVYLVQKAVAIKENSGNGQ